MVTYPITLGTEFDVIPDDTEESLRGSAIHQGAIVTAFDGLRICATRRDLPWFVGNQQTLLIPREDRRLPRRIAPDVFVYPTLAISNPTSIAITGHGPPTLAIEIASPGTALTNDINIFNPTAKPRLYEQIGVAEYLAFDPTREIFGQPIWGQHTGPAGMGPWLPEEDGRWHSALGVSFKPEGHLLRVYDHAGQLVSLSVEFDAMLTAERQKKDEQAQRIAALEAELRQLRDKQS